MKLAERVNTLARQEHGIFGEGQLAASCRLVADAKEPQYHQGGLPVNGDDWFLRAAQGRAAKRSRTAELMPMRGVKLAGQNETVSRWSPWPPTMPQAEAGDTVGSAKILAVAVAASDFGVALDAARSFAALEGSGRSGPSEGLNLRA